MSAHQAPYHFDSAIWKMQTDLAVLLAVALHEREHAMTACGWVVQGQMSLFYLASGFWKINTAFLDHRVSCAPILFLALLEYLPPTLTPLALTRFLTVIAPWTTIIGEMAIGVLVLGNLTMQCLGVALAVVLHFMIAITPFPNQIPTFGVYCLVRLFFSIPESWSTAQAEISAMPLRLGRDVASTIKVAGMALGLALAAKLNSNPAFDVNWAIVLYFGLTYISLYALYLEATTLTPKRKPAREAVPSTGYRLFGWLLLALALLYSFGFQVRDRASLISVCIYLPSVTLWFAGPAGTRPHGNEPSKPLCIATNARGQQPPIHANRSITANIKHGLGARRWGSAS